MSMRDEINFYQDYAALKSKHEALIHLTLDLFELLEPDVHSNLKGKRKYDFALKTQKDRFDEIIAKTGKELVEETIIEDRVGTRLA